MQLNFKTEGRYSNQQGATEDWGSNLGAHTFLISFFEMHCRFTHYFLRQLIKSNILINILSIIQNALVTSDYPDVSVSTKLTFKENKVKTCAE